MNNKSNNKVKVTGADCWALTGRGELVHNGDDNLNLIRSCDNHSNCNKADKYMVPESKSICKCQQRAIVNILDCGDGTACIDFEYLKIITETFGSDGTSKRNVMPIKYCPFCGREL